MDDLIAKALHAARHHLAEGGFLDKLFSGPDYLSTGEEVSPANWGSPDVASDFFKADKALRLAREIQAKADTEARRPPIPDRVVEEAPALPRATMRVAAEPSPSAKIMMLPDVGPYDFGQRIGGAQFREAPPHLTEQPGFGQTIAQGKKYADTTPEIVSRGLQRYTMPAAALIQPPKQAAIPGDIVALASEKIDNRAAPEADKIAARAPQGPELTDRDRDLIIRTIAAETSGKTPEESQAIAHVILNRIQSGKYGASPEAVLLAKKQFEPWSNPAGANYPMRFLPNSRRYGMGQTALEAALSGDDITGGALNFWGPKAQYALGRKAPGWAAEMPDYSDIGETRFHRPRADGGEVDRALHVVREHHADGEAGGQAPETNALGMTPDQFAEYTQTKAPPTPSFVEDALRNVREYAMPRGKDYTHAMGQSAAAADYLTKSGKEGMLSGNPLEMAKGAGMSMLGTALPVIAPVGAAFEAGIINPAERVLGPAGRHAAEVATMVPGEGVGAAMKIARATGEAAPVVTAMSMIPKAAETALSVQKIVSPEERAANLSKFMENAKTPPVLYHASHADIPEFKRTKGSHLGFHFGDVEAANNRLEDTAEKFPWPKADRDERYAISEGHFNKLKAYEEALRRKNTEVPMEELVRALDAGEDVGPIFKKYEYVPTLEEQAQLNALREAYQSSKAPIIPPGGVGANVGAYHVAITNPLRMPDVGNWGSVREIKKHLPFSTDARSQADLLSELKARGYDGIVYQNRVENPVMRTNSFIAFDPEQAKSAIGNAGTFNPAKARLNEAKGGSVVDRALEISRKG
jgi:spore germination cell wall hydrolase CwlJ-like protein